MKDSEATSDKKVFSTISSKTIKQSYGPADLKEFDPKKDLGEAGEFPYTRGPYPNMYRGRLWTMRMFAGFGAAHDTNERFHYLLKEGQTGLSCAFDVPTLMGYDSDDVRSKGEVGKCGVAMDSLADMETLFKGINLGDVSTSMTTNSPATIVFSMYLEVAEQQGVKLDHLKGTIQNDVLKEFSAQKTWIFPPEPSLRLCLDAMEYAFDQVPQWYPVSISGYHIREAGSTAAQELAFTLRDGIEYVENLIKRGHDPNEFGSKLSFFFNAHNDFFEEICKYRAARRLWARTMKERFGVTRPEALRMKFHCQTAGCSLTAQQPLNNVVRTAIQALGGVLGGAQSLHTNSWDETLALPSEDSVRTALRTQQIIAHESGVINTVDPLAGSYFIETLTNELEAEAEDYFKKIDELGGMLAAIEKGYVQREIMEAALKYQGQVEKKEKIIVGVNECVMEEKQPDDLLRIPEQVEKDQVARLKELRMKRNNAALEAALSDLKKEAKTSTNLMPAIRSAVREYGTLGEIVNTLKEVFGEYRDPGIY
jgi:methylmalonyl-CoA mutase, N-terminal domain